MRCFLKLNGNIEIEMENSFKVKEIEKEVVYHFCEYSLEFYLENSNSLKIESAFVEVSGTEYPLEEKIISGKKYFSLKRDNYFSCIFGCAFIALKVMCEGDSEYKFYTKPIEVLINSNEIFEKDVKESIIDMTNFIIENNSNVLKSDYLDRYSLVRNELIKTNYKSLQTEIEQLKDILDIYFKNKIYFMRNQKYQLKTIQKIDSFEKVKRIDNKTISYIINNPNELIASDEFTSIRNNKQSYIPKKTLVDSVENDYDIYENRVILSFIKYITNYISQRIDRIKLQNNIRKINKNNYLSLMKMSYENYLTQLNEMVQISEDLYFQYKSFMKCKEIVIDESIPPTYNFRAYPHYNFIYTIIREWFDKGNYDFSNEKIFSSFLTIDDLYEYFSLINLQNIIEKLNFKLVNKERFKYGTDFEKYNGHNTFRYRNSLGINITLYYQPIVFSNKVLNDLKLYRVNFDRVNHYYSPDFIIQIEMNDKFICIVLDSKWQTIKTIKTYTLKEIIYKYSYSIKPVDKNVSFDSVILLKGRTKKGSTQYDYHNSTLKNEMLLNPETVVLPFSSKDNQYSYLMEKIKKIIENIKL
ncbi:MAG: hypothetical protein ACRC18_05030 [Cetobacterium sp.]